MKNVTMRMLKIKRSGEKCWKHTITAIAIYYNKRKINKTRINQVLQMEIARNSQNSKLLA